MKRIILIFALLQSVLLYSCKKDCDGCDVVESLYKCPCEYTPVPYYLTYIPEISWSAYNDPEAVFQYFYRIYKKDADIPEPLMGHIDDTIKVCGWVRKIKLHSSFDKDVFYLYSDSLRRTDGLEETPLECLAEEIDPIAEGKKCFVVGILSVCRRGVSPTCAEYLPRINVLEYHF